MSEQEAQYPSPLQSYGQNMQEFCQLQKSPQKNSISIRQNDNTLIIKYFLYSQLLSHQVRKVRFLRILRICKFSKFAVFAIFARYLSRSVFIYDNINNIWCAPYAKRSFDHKGDKNIARGKGFVRVPLF